MFLNVATLVSKGYFLFTEYQDSVFLNSARNSYLSHSIKIEEIQNESRPEYSALTMSVFDVDYGCICKLEASVVKSVRCTSSLHRFAARQSTDFKYYVQRIIDGQNINVIGFDLSSFMYLSLVQVARQYSSLGVGSRLLRELFRHAFVDKNLDHVVLAAVPTSYLNEEDDQDFSIADMHKLWGFYKARFNAYHAFNKSDFYLKIDNYKKNKFCIH